MSANQAVLRLGETFYEFFKENPEEYVPLADLCTLVGCENDKTAKSAILKVRKFAEEDGWFFPTAVPGHEFGYVLTHDPNKLIDPIIFHERQAQGITKRKEQFREFVRKHERDLHPAERMAYKNLIVLWEMQEHSTEAAEKLAMNILNFRREERELTVS